MSEKEKSKVLAFFFTWLFVPWENVNSDHCFEKARHHAPLLQSPCFLYLWNTQEVGLNEHHVSWSDCWTRASHPVLLHGHKTMINRDPSRVIIDTLHFKPEVESIFEKWYIVFYK